MYNWVAVAIEVLTLGGMVIMVFVRSNKDHAAMDERQKLHQQRLDKVEAAINNHQSDPVPHKTCSEHTAVLASIDATLQRFENNLNTLDDRVYVLVQNGGKRPEGRV